MNNYFCYNYHMKKVGYHPKKSVESRAFITILIAFLAFLGFLFLVATRPILPLKPELIATPTVETTTLDWAWPSQGRAAIGTLEGGLKVAYGDETPQPIASLAKLITALVVLEKYPIGPNETGPTITMTANDVMLYRQTVVDGGTYLPVNIGQQLTERQMLDGIMLASANNLADSLAIWAFGSMEDYLTVATTWLAKNNLLATEVGKDASGLDPGSISTTRDLFELGRLAMKNPVLREVVAQSTAGFPGLGQISNTDRLRGGDGFVGIKTGYTEEAGGCYIFAVEREVGDESVILIGVVTGQSDAAARFVAAQNLARSAMENLASEAVVTKGQVVGRYDTPWHDSVAIIASDTLQTVRWRDEPLRADAKLNDLRAPAEKNQVVGHIDVARQSINLALVDEVDKPNIWWRIRHMNRLQWLF